ncbi:MAG: hypothetical protein AAF518_22385 [Spirochaetota bacterium]
MKQHYLTILILAFVLSLTSCKSGPVKTPPGWSQNMGNLTWDDATRKCKAMKMRLPSKKEWKKLYDSGITEDWPDGFYWTSEADSYATAYGFIMEDGFFSSSLKSYNSLTHCTK